MKLEKRIERLERRERETTEILKNINEILKSMTELKQWKKEQQTFRMLQEHVPGFYAPAYKEALNYRRS